jgi:hypothetical protein
VYFLLVSWSHFFVKLLSKRLWFHSVYLSSRLFGRYDLSMPFTNPNMPVIEPTVPQMKEEIPPMDMDGNILL